MQHRITRIVWTATGLGGWVFALFLVAESTFSEMLANIAVKKGNFTFFGWCVILLLMAVTWLMIWRMLKEIHYRTSVSALIAFIAAICVGLMEAMSLGTEWPLEIFGTPWIFIMMGLLFGCLLVLVFFSIGKIVLKRKEKGTF